MNKIRIAVIDTWVDTNHQGLEGIDIEIKNIFNMKPNIENGHGTAVCSMISKIFKDIEIVVYPIFDDTQGLNIQILNDTMKYIYEHEQCRIINLSLGTISNEEVDELYKWCKKLDDKGVTIISAFNNNGIMSYPSCFDNVIGIDTSIDITTINDFYTIENSEVNVVGCGNQIRVAWLNGKYILSSGTSFICGYITGLVAQIMYKYNIQIRTEVYEKLKENSKKKVEFKKWNQKNEIDIVKNIKNAIMFPVNKETHSLLRFSDKLSFNVKGVYDVKYKLHVGKKVSDVLNFNTTDDYYIENIENVKWNEEFDTFILGHVKRLSRVMKCDLIREIICKCIKYKKNLYAFDNLEEYSQYLKGYDSISNWFYYPKIEKESVPKGRNCKLWSINTPIVGVFGTSSQQGKFTLQMNLKNCFDQKGYKVDHLGTEPSSMLLGASKMFTFGYGSNINITEYESITIINQMLHEIENSNSDLIIVGSQSGTIPFDLWNLSRIQIPQVTFLYATNPDVILLCVNPHDKIDYIKRTISFLEASINTKVLGIFVFPVIYKEIIIGNFKRIDIAETEMLSDICKSFEEELGRNVLVFNEKSYESITTEIINYLS